MADNLVLITGSGGKTGRAVAAALAKRGYRLRLFRKSNQSLDEVHQQDELFMGDLLQPQDLGEACSDVAGFYHIGPNMHPAEQQIGLNAIQAAEEAGVQHFVYHSVLHPQLQAMPHHWRKLRVEEALIASKLRFTILQPAAYYQNIRHQWQDILASGSYQIPYRVQTRLSQVDIRDVAEVAAKVMLNPDHYFASYPLVGERERSQQSIAELMSQVSGRSIGAVQIDRQAWAEEAAAAGMEASNIQDFIKMFSYYEDHDFLGNDQVLRLLMDGEVSPMQNYFESLARDQQLG